MQTAEELSMGETDTVSHPEDEIDELLLELGIKYVKKTKVEKGNGGFYLHFRIIDCDKICQNDIEKIGINAIELLRASDIKGIQELWNGCKGIVIE